MDLRICPRCGFQNHPDMEKCQKCGASMKDLLSYITGYREASDKMNKPRVVPRRVMTGVPGERKSSARVALSLVIFFLFLGMGLVQLLVRKSSSSSPPRSSTVKVSTSRVGPGLFLKSYEVGIGQKIDSIDYKTNIVAPGYTGYLVFKFHLSKAIPINQIVRFSFRKADSDTPLMTYNYTNQTSGLSFYYGYDRGNRVLTQGVYLCEIFSPENNLIGSISVVVKEN